MDDYQIGYCENGNCDVETFRSYPFKKNCPSCGQYGRLKDPKKSSPDSESRSIRGAHVKKEQIDEPDMEVPD